MEKEYSYKDLAVAFKEMAKVMELEDNGTPVKPKATKDEVEAQIKEASAYIQEGDKFSKTTQAIIDALKVEAEEEEPEEEEANEVEEAEEEEATEGEEPEEEKPVKTKEKAPAKASTKKAESEKKAPANKAESEKAPEKKEKLKKEPKPEKEKAEAKGDADQIGVLYREGSSAWHIYDIVAKAGAKGITHEKVLEQFKARIEKEEVVSDNPESRVKTMLRSACTRELISKNEDRYFKN